MYFSSDVHTVHRKPAGPPIRSGVLRLHPPVLYVRLPRGLGYTAPSSQQIAAGVVSGASTGAAAAISSGSNVVGSISGGLMAAAPFTGPAAPFVAAAGALVAAAAKLFAGCGQTCIQATQYADQAGQIAQQIHDLYFAQPVRTASMQQTALANVQQIIGWLNQMCSNPALGSAGQRCISERIVRGGTAPWCPNPGNKGCDWYTTIVDPIANDPGVVPDPAGASLLSSVGVNPSTTVAGIPLEKLLIPAALLGAWALL